MCDVHDPTDLLDAEYREWLRAQEAAAMKRAPLIETLFGEPADGASERGQDPLAAYLESGVRRTDRAVRETRRLLEERVRLHDEFVRQIDYQISDAAHSLSRFSYWGLGYNRGVDQKRLELERRLEALRRERRSWLVRLWDDLARLGGELRSRREEHEGAVRRARV
jgi:hypothetical protein